MLQISKGMKVVGVDGHDIGWVKDVDADYFVLDRPKAPDLSVPFDACMKVEGDIVWLRVEATQVVKQGWSEPPPAGRAS